MRVLEDVISTTTGYSILWLINGKWRKGKCQVNALTNGKGLLDTLSESTGNAYVSVSGSHCATSGTWREAGSNVVIEDIGCPIVCPSKPSVISKRRCIKWGDVPLRKFNDKNQPSRIGKTISNMPIGVKVFLRDTLGPFNETVPVFDILNLFVFNYGA